MSGITVKVKWNKLSYDVLLEPSAGALPFKQKVQDLTGVPVDRQKLMGKGLWSATLKDDADFSKMKINAGQQILLMGTAEIVVAPQEKVTFFEDLTEEEKAEKGVVVSAGLKNLGNTCYMNATVQCFRHMPEIKDALGPLGPVSQYMSPPAQFSARFRDTVRELESSAQSIVPGPFVLTLRSVFQQFSQRTPQGQWMQQDAEEFYQALYSSLAEALSSVGANMDSFLGLQLEDELICDESTAELPVKLLSKANKLICNIQGGPGCTSVDFIQQGLKLALEGTLEKNSMMLGRNALWRKRQRIAMLPKYICIHFMRFFWKETPESREHAGTKCKIMRGVSYPETIDMFEFCTPDLQEKLRVNRLKEEERMEAKLSGGASGAAAAVAAAAGKVGGGAAAAGAASAPMETDLVEDEGMDEDEREALRAALAMSVADEPSALAASALATATEAAAPLFDNGLPADFNGLFELHSIVTHKGRSADSGHYIGWARQAPGSQFWWKYDDDIVTEVGWDEIATLKGGGDKDMVYLVFYRFKEPRE